MKLLRIATRKSPLAVWQAEHVAALLSARWPGLSVELVRRETRGDKILDQALSKVGGKDLFVKEIEAALFSGEAEVAVHSLKDMPTELPDGLQITAYPAREDPRDAFVSLEGYTVDRLPRGARIGTCSLRRAAQLKARRPDLEIVPIRGNVQTRLERLKRDGLAGTLLALAGLKRLGLESVVSEILPIEQSLPAIGQGILGVETQVRDPALVEVVASLDDPDARAAALAERAFLARLQGGCQVPIAGHAVLAGDRLELRGLVSSLDGQRRIEDQRSGSRADAARIGVELAERLLDLGADQILRELTA